MFSVVSYEGNRSAVIEDRIAHKILATTTLKTSCMGIVFNNLLHALRELKWHRKSSKHLKLPLLQHKVLVLVFLMHLLSFQAVNLLNVLNEHRSNCIKSIDNCTFELTYEMFS